MTREPRKPRSIFDLHRTRESSDGGSDDVRDNRETGEEPADHSSGRQHDGSEKRGGRAGGEKEKRTPIIGILDVDLDEVKKRLGEKNSDIVFREFAAGGCDGVRMVLMFVDGLIDKESINGRILKSLMVDAHVIDPDVREGKRDPYVWVKDALLTIGEVKEADFVEDAIDAMLSGDAPLLIEGVALALVPSVKGWPTRGIAEPETEAVVRGPHEGFVETLRVNTALVRHRLRAPGLRVEALKIGERTKTDVALLYIEGIANEKLVGEVRARLKAIKTDGILDTGYIEQLIEDHPFSPFPQLGNTERPDRVVGYLLEGRLAVMVDGSPFALVMPAELNTFMQSPEDYFDRPINAAFLRTVRFFASLSALVLPSLYVAAVTFHPELLPTPLLLSIAAGREKVPFPAVVEVLLMEFVFETLREAGVRLPRPFGQAIGIVGAIVIGQAAVTAGLVGPFVVIIVSLTAIATFAFPSFLMANSLRLIRFPLILLTAIAGLYGMVWGLIVMTIHLMTLRSVGVPYFYPWTPTSIRGILRDTLVRAPLWTMRHRPDIVRPEDVVRQKSNLKPPSNSKRGEGDEGHDE